MPNLLVAPQSPPPTNASSTRSSASPDRCNRNISIARGGGYYADGAYVAVPDVDNVSRTRTFTGNAAGESEIDLDLDPQEAYYLSLLNRFTALEIILRSPPSPDATSSSSIPLDIIHSIRKWRWVLLHRQPTMKLLSYLPQESVINGLAALESLLQRGELRQKDTGERLQRLGAWAWGLLAKCREVGEMGSEEVGVLRGLGKIAWWAMREIKAGVGVGGTEEEEEEEEEQEETEDVNEEGEMEDGVDDEVEEGEVQSERDQQGSDGGDDHDVNDDMDVENHQDSISPNHVTWSTSIITDNTSITNTSVHHHTQTTTTNININPSSLSKSSPPKSPPPPSTVVPISIVLPNGHQHQQQNQSQNQNPSPSPFSSSASLSPSRDRSQDGDSVVCNNNDNINNNNKIEPLGPADPVALADPVVLAAAQQHLLKLLEPDGPNEQKQQEPALLPSSQHMSVSGNHHSKSGENGVDTEAKVEAEVVNQLKINMIATLDMILTIVGERYGQRDLLVGRGFWGDGE